MKAAVLGVLLALGVVHGLGVKGRVSPEPGFVLPPPHLQDVGTSADHVLLELTFAVKQQNLEELLDVFNAVSDPKNPRYGQHLTNTGVHDLIRPRNEDIKAVTDFLESFGLRWKAATPNSDMITTICPVAVANKMMQASYRTFKDGNSQIHHRTLSYSLPANVARAVDLVAPTTHFPPHRDLRNGQVLARSNLGLSPNTIRELYNVTAVGSTPENIQAVTAFLEQHYSEADLKEFFNLLYPAGKGTPVTTKGDEPTGFRAGIEAMLDIEYIIVTGTNISSEFWGFSGRSEDNPENEPFIKWLELVSTTSDEEVPKLFSTSYGEDEDSVSSAWADRLNAEFQKAGARGISLLFASGDSGAAGTGGGCKSGKFVPQWPAGSPFVTAVGGTTGNPESAASLSSGGFSNRYLRPEWQDSAVQAYLSRSDIPDASAFNKTGRGFPDISAQATGFTVVANRIPNPGVAGTSCACPTAAGVFALLNDIRLGKGQPSLGFLNPLIYQSALSFNDITTGRGGGCREHQGYPAVPGWDAVTGVGTPNFGKLRSAIAL